MANMDTAEKRLSCMDWDCPFMPGIAVPTLTPGAGERQHGMWTYSGIASSAPATGGDSGASTPGATGSPRGVLDEIAKKPGIRQVTWNTPGRGVRI